jgi:hypothetical protein
MIRPLVQVVYLDKDILAWFRNIVFRVTVRSSIRHSRMLLAGIRRGRWAGFPPKACGNDDAGVTRF